MKRIHSFASFIKESANEARNLDFSKSSHKIIVGLKSNLIKDMKDRYEYVDVIKNEIYFYKGRKNNLVHFATLFDAGTRYQVLHHDGSINDYGWLKEGQRHKPVNHIENIEPKKDEENKTVDYANNYIESNIDSCPRCGEHQDDCECSNTDPWSTQNYHRVPKGIIKKEKAK